MADRTPPSETALRKPESQRGRAGAEVSPSAVLVLQEEERPREISSLMTDSLTGYPQPARNQPQA